MASTSQVVHLWWCIFAHGVVHVWTQKNYDRMVLLPAPVIVVHVWLPLSSGDGACLNRDMPGGRSFPGDPPSSAWIGRSAPLRSIRCVSPQIHSYIFEQHNIMPRDTNQTFSVFSHIQPLLISRNYVGTLIPSIILSVSVLTYSSGFISLSFHHTT